MLGIAAIYLRANTTHQMVHHTDAHGQVDANNFCDGGLRIIGIKNDRYFTQKILLLSTGAHRHSKNAPKSSRQLFKKHVCNKDTLQKKMATNYRHQPLNTEADLHSKH